MKKIIFIFLLVISITKINLAQKMESAVLNKENVSSIFNYVGQIHNQSLDYFYNSIKEKSEYIKKNLSTNEEKQNFLRELVSKEDPKNPVTLIFTPSPTFPTFNSLGGVIQTQFNKTIENANSALQGRSSSITTSTIQNLKLEGEEKAYVDELISQVEMYSNNLDELKTALELFNEKVFNKFGTNSNSTYSLLAGSYTALYSSIYWQQNKEKWILLKKDLDITSNSNMRESCCGGILTADAAGAVGGAVTGALGGAMGGTATIPGVGTVAGAAGGAVVGAVVGGVGNSAQQAATNLINWISSWF